MRSLNNAPTARKPGKEALPFSHGFAPHTSNLVSKLIYHPCSVPFQVYVETFIPAFVKMVVTIVSWDLDDIVRSIGGALIEEAKPPTRGRKRHYRRIPVQAGLSPGQRRAAQGLGTLLRWTEPLEKIGYLMLLYHATEQFSRDWTTMLGGFEHCGKPESEGPLQRHCDPRDVVSNGQDLPLDLDIVDQNRALWAGSDTGVEVPFGHYQCTLECTFEYGGSGDWWGEVSFGAAFTVPYGPMSSGQVHGNGPGSISVLFTVHIFVPTVAGTRINWFRRSVPIPVGIHISQASVSIYSFQPGRQ